MLPLLLALAGTFWAQGQAPTAQKMEQKNTLLLRDFQPKSMLHAPVHNVYRARFPVIDVHNHVNDARTPDKERILPAKVVEMMDNCSLQKIVILTGGWGEALQNHTCARCTMRQVI
jgi:hypothetical protein